MNYRAFGRTGWTVSEISFGAWAIGGGQWGGADDDESMATLHRALDLGVNFFDTADVYGDGRSERLIARLRRERSEPFHVATKAGRRLSPHTADGYNAANLTQFVERSLKNLAMDRIELLQLHCPPTEVLYRPEDHRHSNREGQLFDRGETFSGVDYATGLRAVERLRPLVPAGASLAQLALRWILMFDAVSCIIPGARRPSQLEDNVGAAALSPLSDTDMAAIKRVYDEDIRPLVHHRW